ncbi:MAG: hydantoinase/oxoprolinase family protein [Thermoplasmata archaeon]
MAHTYYIGIDIGGTFTDLIVFNVNTKNTRILKVPSTPTTPEKAVVDGLSSLGIDPKDIALITHASTVATNALLTKSGLAKAALITNKGLRDVLEIGRQRRSEIYNLKFTRPLPLIERNLRFTVRGRISSEGKEIESLDVKEIQRLKFKLSKKNIESIAISLLNSYRNNVHEFSIKKQIAGLTDFVFASSEVNPEFREYERTSTTVVNAVLAPLVSKYLKNLQDKFTKMDITSPFYVMGSNGGLNTASYASTLPISVIESGPSAGVIASSFISNLQGIKKVMTFDMGGTTAKAGIVIDGKPDLSSEFEAAGKTHSGRSIKGSGYAVRFPFIDLAEVSAGGGTVAWIDEGGSLRVGPKSSGADPGPAAYNRGGTDPTVTDANIILGRINPEYLLGGQMKIHKELSEKAIREKITKYIGNDVTSVAEGIVRLANNVMAKALSIVSVERGRDPRDFVMMAFGGAGPIHACDLASELEMKSIVVPPNPGLFSAFGLLTVDIVRPFSKSVVGLSFSEVEEVIDALEVEAISSLHEEGFKDVKTERVLDLHYLGQSFEISVPFEKDVDPFNSFKVKHNETYGYSSDDPTEIVNARIMAKATLPKIEVNEALSAVGEMDMKWRKAYLSGTTLEVPVIRRETIPRETNGTGPAIVEGYDSTIVINPGWSWKTDKYLNFVIRRD